MNKINEILISHKIIPGCKGYDYVRYIILSTEENISQRSIVKDIYMNVAKEFKTTSSRVERAIRHVISLSDLEVKKNKRALSLLQIEYQAKENDDIDKKNAILLLNKSIEKVNELENNQLTVEEMKQNVELCKRSRLYE